MLKRHLSGRRIPPPHILAIEVTSRCNLRCIMCPKTAGFVNTSPDRVISPAVVDRLEISVDAARPETYRRVRRGGELEQVLEGVRAVVRHKERSGRRFPEIKLLFLGMTDTIAEFPAFVRLAHSLGAGTVVLQAMGEYAAVKGKSVAAGHREEGRRCLEAARAEARRLGVAIELFPPDQFSAAPPAGAPTQAGAPGLAKDCFFPWDRAVIATTGEVFPCCSSPVPFGDLTRQPFREIWYGAPYRALRRALLEGDLPPMCRTCTGQAWTVRRPGDLLKEALRLERGRLRQRLRRSPFLRRIKDSLWSP